MMKVKYCVNIVLAPLDLLDVFATIENAVTIILSNNNALYGTTFEVRCIHLLTHKN